jgi:poly(3-hydroxyalkanoate) depolymerase
LLICNGLGANLELIEPLASALTDIETVLFDVPGVGGSPRPKRPYRFKTLARLADRMMAALGYHGAIDVMGVSWGGALAQQIARTWGPQRCRRLVLAATVAGGMMIPGRWKAVIKLMNPRRYTDSDYLTRVAQDIYGGAVAHDPSVILRFAEHMESPDPRGYFYQQLAMVGWTSVRWLPSLRQPALVLSGKKDPLVHPINARVLALLIRRSQLELVDDGHLFVLTNPSVIPIITRFLSDHRREDRSYATQRRLASPS